MARIDRRHDGRWVDCGTSAWVNLEVQMWGCGVSGCTIGAEDLPGSHLRSDGDVRRNRVEVGVEEVGTVCGRQANAIAGETCVVVHLGDRAVDYGIDEVAFGRDDVNTLVRATTARLLPRVHEAATTLNGEHLNRRNSEGLE